MTEKNIAKTFPQVMIFSKFYRIFPRPVKFVGGQGKKLRGPARLRALPTAIALSPKMRTGPGKIKPRRL
jgi:hypothetical protein